MAVLSEEFRLFLNRQHNFLLAQWLACLASLVLYLLPSSSSGAKPFDDQYSELARHALWLITIGLSFYLVWSKKRIHTVDAFLYALRGPILAQNIRGATSLEMRAHALFRIYQFRMFVVFFLCHVIAMLGLFLRMVADPADQHAAIMLSAAVMIYYYPARFFFSRLMNEYERREAARGWDHG